jgi:hypothetical protein
MANELDETNRLSQTKKLSPRAAMPMYERALSAPGDVSWHIKLKVQETEDVLDISIDEAITLGRKGLGTFDYPHYNLMNYNAHEHGVSRVHARLSVHKHGIMIHDLSSTNGTFLNSYRLEPFTDINLQNDDVIELGQFKLQVVFMQPGK